MTQLRQNISAFFRDQRTFRVVDGFLLLLPWVLLVLVFREERFWIALFGLLVIIVMLWIDRPWFSQRYLISAGGLGVYFLSPIPFFAVAFFCAYVVAEICDREVGFSYRFSEYTPYFDRERYWWWD